ncbi:Eukaryotic translation initiation factor 2B [Mactra antiquata]
MAKEFQPVVLAAGKGSRMTDLTSQNCKALLPIGNMPMLWYPIDALQRAGFEEAIVIVLSSYCAEAQKLLVEVCDVQMRLDFVSIPDQDYMGTADSLRYIRDKIKRDVLIISCDLIMDISLHNIANIYRTYDATVTMLLCSPSDQTTEVPVPGPKSKKKSERDFIGFEGNRVLYMTSEADLADLDEDVISFRRSVFKKHPSMNIKSNLTDCHLYIIKKWVIDYLADNRQISSIKGELIPLLVKKQFSKAKKKELPNPNESVISEEVKTDILSYIPKDDMSGVIQNMSSWIDHTGDMEDCFHGNTIRCYAHIVKGGMCLRTNTVGSYCETNRQIPKYLMGLDKDLTNVASSASLKGKPQIGADCLIGDSCNIGEKVSIKRSVIGRHCTVGEKIKITNSVILDHVNIAEG